ncbi:MAG: tRNA lysidine(34) synthetase TilS [Deltaproteobacteria bacterium]|nr:tRNA lysidine(34) synthetase TilS [Deltaproteobacteria bacterium]
MGGKGPGKHKVVVAVSGGPDSVWLLHRALEEYDDVVVAHVNHGARGGASDEDERFVKRMAEERGLPVRILRVRNGGQDRPGFEERARRTRYAYLRKLKNRENAGAILAGHTADDQVETILMRVFRGAGISGLKGIPRDSEEGIVRPLLDTWREEVLASLRRRAIPHRQDESNADTRFERNWVRHVVIPLLERRYGKSVKKRIFALGERFREIDEFLSEAAGRWLKRNAKASPAGTKKAAGAFHRVEAEPRGSVVFPRKAFAKLPSLVRMKVLQVLCFERAGIAPNERLLKSMDRLIVSGGPSAALSLGGGATLERRYEEAVFRKRGEERGSRGARTSPATTGATATLRETAVIRGPGVSPLRDGRVIVIRECGSPSGAGLRLRTKMEAAAYFDPEALAWPVRVRPLRAGDRIFPFGMDGEKKVKEVLIDRKVPRTERWGRPVVCDGRGRIIWIPGVIRSAWAPVGREARGALLFEIRAGSPQVP